MLPTRCLLLLLLLLSPKIRAQQLPPTNVDVVYVKGGSTDNPSWSLAPDLNTILNGQATDPRSTIDSKGRYLFACEDYGADTGNGHVSVLRHDPGAPAGTNKWSYVGGRGLYPAVQKMAFFTDKGSGWTGPNFDNWRILSLSEQRLIVVGGGHGGYNSACCPIADTSNSFYGVHAFLIDETEETPTWRKIGNYGEVSSQINPEDRSMQEDYRTLPSRVSNNGIIAAVAQDDIVYVMMFFHYTNHPYSETTETNICKVAKVSTSQATSQVTHFPCPGGTVQLKNDGLNFETTVNYDLATHGNRLYSAHMCTDSNYMCVYYHDSTETNACFDELSTDTARTYLTHDNGHGLAFGGKFELPRGGLDTWAKLPNDGDGLNYETASGGSFGTHQAGSSNYAFPGGTKWLTLWVSAMHKGKLSLTFRPTGLPAESLSSTFQLYTGINKLLVQIPSCEAGGSNCAGEIFWSGGGVFQGLATLEMNYFVAWRVGGGPIAVTDACDSTVTGIGQVESNQFGWHPFQDQLPRDWNEKRSPTNYLMRAIKLAFMPDESEAKPVLAYIANRNDGAGNRVEVVRFDGEDWVYAPAPLNVEVLNTYEDMTVTSGGEIVMAVRIWDGIDSIYSIYRYVSTAGTKALTTRGKIDDTTYGNTYMQETGTWSSIGPTASEIPPTGLVGRSLEILASGHVMFTTNAGHPNNNLKAAMSEGSGSSTVTWDTPISSFSITRFRVEVAKGSSASAWMVLQEDTGNPGTVTFMYTDLTRILGASFDPMKESVSFRVSFQYNGGAGIFVAQDVSTPRCPNEKYTYDGGCVDVCPVGREGGAGACLEGPCKAGTVSSADGTCANCSAGKHAEFNSTTECLACPSGRRSGVKSATCSTCSAGRYAAMEETATCSACDKGQFATNGSSSCSLCSVGKFGTVVGHATCVDCPLNTKSDVEGATSCISCPAFSGTNAEGATSCQRDPDLIACLTDKTALQGGVDVLTTQNLSLTEDKVKLEGQKTAWLAEKTSLERNIDVLTKRNKSLTEDKLKLQREKTVHLADNMVCLTEKTSLEKNIDVLTEQNTSLSEANRNLDADKIALQSEKESLESDKRSLNVDKIALQSAKESLESDNAALVLEKTALTGALATSQGKVSKLQAALDAALAEVNTTNPDENKDGSAGDESSDSAASAADAEVAASSGSTSKSKESTTPTVMPSPSSSKQNEFECSIADCDALLVKRTGLDSGTMMVFGFGFFIYVVTMTFFLLVLLVKKWKLQCDNHNPDTTAAVAVGGGSSVKVQPVVQQEKGDSQRRLTEKLSGIDNNEEGNMRIAHRRRSRHKVDILGAGSSSGHHL